MKRSRQAGSGKKVESGKKVVGKLFALFELAKTREHKSRGGHTHYTTTSTKNNTMKVKCPRKKIRLIDTARLMDSQSL